MRDLEPESIGHWETDEFEDLITRSLIGLYETNIKEEKKGPKSCRFNRELFLRMRRIGCYFAPSDRVIAQSFDENGRASRIQEIDKINDGRPNDALWSTHPRGLTTDPSDYLWTFYMEKVPYLPSPWKCHRKGMVYRCMQIFFNSKVEGCGTFVVIDSNGMVESCYIPINYTHQLTGQPMYFEQRPRMLSSTGEAQDYYASYASIGVQIFSDKNHLWNVRASEGTSRATFGVHEEQIKSLFYARDLPQTITGRKRPILHWVNAHQRRLKNGTDVVISDYLRGAHEFVMNGTKFSITNPKKGEE